VSALLSDRAELHGVAFRDSGVMREVEAALERARVVGVLDAWASDGYREHRAMASSDGRGVCALFNYARKSPYFYGKTIDEARAAAAKAIEAGEV
jgi:hypothetical protein